MVDLVEQRKTLEALKAVAPHMYYGALAEAHEDNCEYKDAKKHYLEAFAKAKEVNSSRAMKYLFAVERCDKAIRILGSMKANINTTWGYGYVNKHSTTVGAIYEFNIVPREFLNKAKAALPSGFTYQVVKYNQVQKEVTFMHVPTFYSAFEPLIEGGFVVNHKLKVIPLDVAVKRVILDKWTMVHPNSMFFNVKASKRRTVQWRSLKVPSGMAQRAFYRDTWNKIVPHIGKAFAKELV